MVKIYIKICNPNLTPTGDGTYGW